MALPPEIVARVRQRANFACEFCGVSETDSGGELTIDHFQPQVHAGTDDLGNLVYCCFRCNLYKADYWPAPPGDQTLWNPRREPRDGHLLLLADGRLHPMTDTGQFTVRLLRLNRPTLVAHRLRRQLQGEEARVLRQHQELVKSLQ